MRDLLKYFREEQVVTQSYTEKTQSFTKRFVNSEMKKIIV